MITLVIIGVIAAITVPTLITKYQKEQTVTRLKKAYSDLSNAVRLSELSNGHISSWDFSLSADSFIDKYLRTFILLNKNTMNNYLNKVKIYDMKGKEVDTNTLFTLSNNSKRIIELSNGSILIFDSTNSDIKNGYVVAVDINGYKKPNKMGRDIFVFGIQKFQGVQPYHWICDNGEENNYSREELLTVSRCAGCNKNSRWSYGCTALIMKDGWRIADDYPW